MNHVAMSGRLTKDPEVRVSQSGTTVAKFSLAVTRPMAKDTTDFFNCTCFGKTAEAVEKYFRKGSKVIVEGYVTIDEYTDKNGNKARSTNVIVQNWEFAESKGEAKADTKTETKTEAKTDADGFLVIADGVEEELPFM